jgi:hypothetical protein
MKNEIYRQICEKQEAIQQQVKEEVEKLYGVELLIHVRIDIQNIPINLMPDGSKEQSTDNMKWLHYSEGFSKPNLYGKTRRFKIVFEDEPANSNQP